MYDQNFILYHTGISIFSLNCAEIEQFSCIIRKHKRKKKDMKDIKIIFFDIDGTLIAMDKDTISDKTLEALKRLQANGIKLCLATGKDHQSLFHILMELNLMHFLHTMVRNAMIMKELSIAIAFHQKILKRSYHAVKIGRIVKFGNERQVGCQWKRSGSDRLLCIWECRS